MTYDFEAQKLAWSTPPVGGRNRPATDLLGLTDAQLVRWVDETYRDHYAQDSNRNNRMVDLMKLDTTHGQTVLDFGCGFGMDALRYARAGNKVLLVDIVLANLQVASRILQVHGFRRPLCSIATNDPPFCAWPKIDVFHANGVLHHTPNARAILERVVLDALKPDGEIRLMLYTDHLFKVATGADPHSETRFTDVRHQQFVRFADAVGDYADWYDQPKLAKLVDGLGLDIIGWEYLRWDCGYAVATLKRTSDLAA